MGLLLAAVAAAALLLLVVFLFQHRLMYFPDRTRPDPVLAGLHGVIEGHVTAEDGLRLLTWTVPPAGDDKPVLLYLHGNGGNLLHRAPRIQRFAALGWGVVMLEWRGYGGNPGSPSEPGLLRDARAALAAIAEAGIPASRIVLWGESLGTGIAVALAAERPDAVAAVLLESPYTSMLALAARHYRWLPARWLLRDRYDSLARIGGITAPILIMTGGRDWLVPPAMGDALAAAARAPVERWNAPEAGHNDLGAAGAVEAAAEFLGRHLRHR
ncbi:alpha/beta hydrolase [Roseomonas hellenica]|uniref:Alpha/beta hydrolase n=1 Tax=Plastoroseomonas hellenica TaxID=2687306 RepID=A0ABS5F0V8_9PROT|nr:alpha/beta hydrolase [Plastoroseomonas hellenica]MBR0666166.1 alpha/beta hydrolase [Plastoroseomonas hellenica]